MLLRARSLRCQPGSTLRGSPRLRWLPPQRGHRRLARCLRSLRLRRAPHRRRHRRRGQLRSRNSPGRRTSAPPGTQRRAAWNPAGWSTTCSAGRKTSTGSGRQQREWNLRAVTPCTRSRCSTHLGEVSVPHGRRAELVIDRLPARADLPGASRRRRAVPRGARSAHDRERRRSHFHTQPRDSSWMQLRRLEPGRS